MKRIAVLAAASLLAASCASLRNDPGAEGCSSRDSCVVTVVVRGCSARNIVAKPEVLHVRKGYSGDIEWRLDAPPKWEFAENGIEFKDPGSLREFGEKKKGARDFRWFDKNTKPGPHEYNINVVSPETGKTCTLDPTIMNDDHP